MHAERGAGGRGLSLFNVVTKTAERKEERAFRDKPEAMDYAVRRLAFYGGGASVVIENEGGIVFDQNDIRRTFETVRA
jgi:hypothetical protein